MRRHRRHLQIFAFLGNAIQGLRILVELLGARLWTPPDARAIPRCLPEVIRGALGCWRMGVVAPQEGPAPARRGPTAQHPLKFKLTKLRILSQVPAGPGGDLCRAPWCPRRPVPPGLRLRRCRGLDTDQCSKVGHASPSIIPGLRTGGRAHARPSRAFPAAPTHAVLMPHAVRPAEAGRVRTQRDSPLERSRRRFEARHRFARGAC